MSIGRGANVKDAQAFLAAASACQVDMITYLLDAGASLEERYVKGEIGARSENAPGYGTPLRAVVRAEAAESEGESILDGKRHLGAVNVLLKAGADLRAKDTKGLTPREAAEESKFERVTALLRQHERPHGGA